MNILIAADSFKDALPALEVCTAIAKGLRQANPAIQPQLFPMADGGEGTADILTFHNNGQQMQCTVLDPLGRPVEATYGISQDGQTAFMEMAQASGIQLLTEAERNPLLASTYGTGQLIAHALERGIRKIVLGIGGSATNDMGMGMLRALGYRFWDASAKELAGTGADLTKVTQFEESKRNEGLQDLELTIICDVDNPLYGPNGAAHVYGQQKGATPEMIQQLDMGLRQFATIIETQK
ncbi:MAG: glycerate kinase, partial [Bacteroidota bacterium]